jgi:hypothetical protein
MLRARVYDPAGPRWWRVMAAVGALPLALVAVALPWSPTARAVAMLIGVAWLAVGRLVVPRLAPRGCSIALERGAIRVKNAGAVSQRVAAADVRAASTSELAGGAYSLALVRHEEGDPPLWLELDTQADLDQVRRALGIGHAGFGTMRCPPERGGFHNMPTAADAVAALGWVGIVMAVSLGATEVALALALPIVPLTLVAMVMATTSRAGRHRVLLTPQGVHVVADGHATLLPWETIIDAKVEGTGIAIQARAGRQVVPMGRVRPRARDHIASQIRSGAARARGEGPLPPELPASVSVLSPRDEGRRAWLERLDATAASLAQGEGYRQAGMEARDLWTVMESPDAPPTLRAAAARILARVAPEEAGDRIAKALAMEHDRDTRQCIRVALEEDVDVAARELDRLDEL